MSEVAESEVAESEVRSKFVGLLAEIAGMKPEDVRDEYFLGDLGMDSIDMNELDMGVDVDFGIEQGLDRLYTSVASDPRSDGYRPVQNKLTVGRIVNYIEERLKVIIIKKTKNKK